MLITRKIGKFFRGKATPLQIMLAAILGGMLGFTPGFYEAAGLNLTLVALLVILNANLMVAGLTALAALAVAVLAVPVSFTVGRALLDGPTQPLFQWAVNTPILAWFGFDYYVVTGGLAIGLIFGVVVGFVLVRLLTAFRRKMASLQEGSDRYQRLAGAWWAKLLTFVFIGGGRGTKAYADLASKKLGNPIRILGVVVVVGLAALGYIGSMFLSEPIVTALTRDGLERANGATVDLASAELDLGESRMTIHGLAMADPNALDTDLLRAATVEANLSTRDLLRKRIAIDRVQITDAAHGVKRDRPGRLIGDPLEPPPSQTGDEDIREGEKTLDDYVRQAEEWKARLEQIREWLDKIDRPEEAADEDVPAEEREEETLEERLKRQIAEMGYARVTASHLIDNAPTLLISELIIEGLKTPKLEGETLDVYGRNLSTHPWLVDAAPEIEVKTRSSDKLGFALTLGEAAGVAEANDLRFHYHGLSTDETLGGIQFPGGKAPLSEGTLDVAADGIWWSRDGGSIEFPLIVTFHDALVTVPGGDSSRVERLDLPIGVRGPIVSPRIAFDDKRFTDALVEAGKAQLAAKFDAEKQKLLDKAAGELEEKIGDEVGEQIGGEAKKLLDGVFGGGDKKNDDGGN